VRSYSGIGANLSGSSKTLHSPEQKFIAPNPIPKTVLVSKLSSSAKATQRPDINKIIINNQLGKGDTPQMGIMKSGLKSEFSGHPITFGDSGEPTILTDTSESKVVLSPGLGGGSSKRSLHASWLPVSQLIDKNIIIYAPLTDTDRPARFRRGLPGYYDRTYINQEESENFFNKILKNRFFDDKGILKNPENISNLVLFGFSIGHRENLSHINYLHKQISKALLDEGSDKKFIQNYFDKISLINIASPLNWDDIKLPTEILEGLESGRLSPADAEKYRLENPNTKQLEEDKLPKFTIINYRSVVDMGTSKPISDFNVFHCNKNFYVPKIFSFGRFGMSGYEVMYIIGRGLIEESFIDEGDIETIKTNGLGHDLSAYVDAISKNTDLMIPITNLLKGRVNTGLGFIRTFNPDKNPTDEDRSVLKLEWGRQVEKAEAMKFYRRELPKKEKEVLADHQESGAGR